MSKDSGKRTSNITRETGETRISLRLDLDGSGKADINSGALPRIYEDLFTNP